MPEHGPRYRYWGDRKPVMLARPAETVEMAASSAGKTAKVRLYGPIDSWGAPFGVAASEVAAALDAIGESTPVEMHVHSPGGDAFEGLAIMNLLRQHKGGVDIVVDGLAASAASIVAMGAKSVTMVPGSQLMIHDASALAIGQADDMRQAADMLDSISSNAADQYAAKAGKPADEMRAAMKATTWYKAQQAVDAGLADAVLADDDPQTASAKAATASLTFDLSMFEQPKAADRSIAAAAAEQIEKVAAAFGRDLTLQIADGAVRLTKTPAEQPVTPPTPPEEADTMSDTIPKAGLIKALGLADDADEDQILDAADKLVQASQAKPAAEKPVDVKAVASALEADGKVVVSKLAFDELTEQAKAGADARAKQLADERDETIAKAFADGKISADRRDAWKASWDKDPEGTKADLDSLPARFPVAALQGHAGSDDSDGGSTQPFNDDQAAAVAAQFGISKEALING